ncbi:hypothetical protein LZ31DRAFT_442098, partial [Colletotrichum somersetense]
NILIYTGIVSIATLYHKNFIQIGHYRAVYWFLLQAVGELVVVYLAFILPFWQFLKA